MAMNLCFSSANATIVEDLLHFGNTGDSKVLYGSWRNHTSYYGFIFTKYGKNLLKVYAIYRGYVRNADLKYHIAEISKSSKDHGGGKIKWLKASKGHNFRRSRNNDGYPDWLYRAFMSLGIVHHVGVRYMRIAELWKFQDIETVSIRSKDFSFGFNGKLISQIPKECKKLFDLAIDNNRIEKNRSARANYANTSTVAKVRNARVTGDYSKLVPQDVFKLRNVATRTELLEYYGQDKVLESMEPDVIHSDEIDGRKYELLRFSLPFQLLGQDDPTLATYLKMINPSTGEVCIEGVPNSKTGSRWSSEINMDLVTDALAWRDGDTSDYVIPQVLT